MKTLIIIPAYNEETTIGSIVLLSKKYGDVLVVDDGSTDRTSEIAEGAGAIVIRHDENKGKGMALRTGFEYAINRGYDVVIAIDADGQHNPDEIPLLIDPIIKGEADLVIGSRYMRGAFKKIPLYRRFGLWILNKGTQLAADINVDSQSGFRALNRKALTELDLTSSGYSIETDMIIKAREKGLRIKEVPIRVNYSVPNKHKKNPISHGFDVLTDIVGLIGYRRPLLLFSLLSLIFFLGAAFLFYWALKPVSHGGPLLLTQAIGAGVFTIIGIQLMVAGLTLNVLVKLMRE